MQKSIDQQHEDIAKQLADADERVAAEQQGQQEQQASSSKPSGRVKSEAHKARDAADAKAAMAASHKLKVDSTPILTLTPYPNPKPKP